MSYAYRGKFVRDNVVAPFLQVAVVIVPEPHEKEYFVWLSRVLAVCVAMVSRAV